jgi:hypothetical protein
MTSNELAALRSDELPDGVGVWVTHRFRHPGASDEQRAAFHVALRTAGFGTPGTHTEIGADEELTGDGHWHHWAFTVIEASADELRDADVCAREVATAHGVQYDGWAVQRHETTGKPLSGARV